MEVDLPADNWKIFLNGVLKHDGSFGGASAIDFFRFTTALLLINLDGATAAIDNVFAGVNLPPPPPPTPTQLAACPLDSEPLADNCTASGQDSFFIFHDPTKPFVAPAECACTNVTSEACIDALGADQCFEAGENIRRASGITIVNKPGSFCTVYCYSLDGVRLCQEFCVP